MKPKDGKPLPEFVAGQYISVKVNPPGQRYTHIRQYSLSDCFTPNYYRISVKREDSRGNLPEGIVSNYLHGEVQEGDILLISGPQGEFNLDLNTEKPIVFLSGGVGLTPLTSMIKTWHEKKAAQNVTWIHAGVNGRFHALRKEIDKIAETNSKAKMYTVYQKPTIEDQKNEAFEKEGYIELEWLKDILLSKDAEFYFCGPEPFKKVIYNGLLNWGVPGSSIHFEFFGPTASLVEQVVTA